LFGSAALAVNLKGSDFDVFVEPTSLEFKEAPIEKVHAKLVSFVSDIVRIDGPNVVVPLLKVNFMGRNFDLAFEQARASLKDSSVISSLVTRPVHLEFIRVIRVWSRQRRLTGANFGLMPGVGWHILCVHLIRLFGGTCTTVEELVAKFFTFYARYDWNHAIFLDAESNFVRSDAERRSFMYIFTGVANCTSRILKCSFEVIKRELL
jgi:poly(A) polymerase Pap1